MLSLSLVGELTKVHILYFAMRSKQSKTVDKVKYPGNPAVGPHCCYCRIDHMGLESLQSSLYHMDSQDRHRYTLHTADTVNQKNSTRARRNRLWEGELGLLLEEHVVPELDPASPTRHHRPCVPRPPWLNLQRPNLALQVGHPR